MSSLEIEDVLASIRRLVSDDLRPANRPGIAGKLLLTPALRVVSQTASVGDGDAREEKPLQNRVDAGGVTTADARGAAWVPDRSSISAVSDQDADHLDFAAASSAAAHETGRVLHVRSAMESAAEAFHDNADEFILSLGDGGALVLGGERDEVRADIARTETLGHDAVFAVLTRHETVVRIPAVAELADAEGGAPIEEEPQWSVVSWDDPVAPETVEDAESVEVDASVKGNDDSQDVAAEGQVGTLEPLVSPFVSMRRAYVAPAEDAPLQADRAAEVPPLSAKAMTRPAAPLILRTGLFEETPLFGTVRTKHGQMSGAPEPGIAAAAAESEVVAAVVAAEHGDATAVAADRADAVIGDTAKVEVSNPEAAHSVVDADAVVAGIATAEDPLEDLRSRQQLAIAASADVGDVAMVLGEDLNAMVLPDQPVAATATATDAGAGLANGPATAAEPEPTLENLFGAAPTSGATVPPPEGAKAKAARLSEAAFTRWPGWAQSAPETASAQTPAVVAPHKKHKVAKPDLGWADRAEAEIHRELAAELGGMAMQPTAVQTPGLQLSEAALRDLVRDTIREELSGKLGERITENVRKLVQMELQKALSVQVGEFRSQRREPGSET